MKRTGERVKFNEMPSGELVRYLTDTQHPFLLKALSTFSLCGKSIADAYVGEKNAVMMTDLLQKLESLIKKYLEEEEKSFFDHLRLFYSGQPVTDLTEWVSAIRKQHEVIARLFEKVRVISDHYTPPKGASASLKLCYAQLFNFEQDILKHLFLEEDILFPKLLEANKQKMNRYGSDK